MKETSEGIDRRGFVKRSLLASAGVAAAASLEEAILLAAVEGGAAETSGAPSADAMPMGRIGKLEISRMICGGNLIGGYAHSRDLVYVSSLMKQYNTDTRVLDTLELCEKNGINALLSDTGERPRTLINRYWKERGGKMKWLVDSRPKPDDIKATMRPEIDAGASAIYVNGGWAEEWVREGKVDLFGKVIEFARENGLPGGVGGHLLDVPVACEKAGIKPDFYMKTLHSRKYWSAEHAREHDNIWCRNPEETIEFMKNVTAPWLAYKVLAAGAISPTSGFKFALENGADFVCVGMFDFQVNEDVKIFKGLFDRGVKRERPWRG